MIPRKEKKQIVVNPFLQMTMCAGGFRVNEFLLGKFQALRRSGDIFESRSQPLIKSTTPRPIEFGSNLFRWLTYVKSERKRVAEDLIAKELEERQNISERNEERNRKALAERKIFLDNFFKPLK